MADFATVLKKRIDEITESHEEVLTSGTPSDYPEYREMVGVLRGLTLATRELEDLLRTMEVDDD